MKEKLMECGDLLEEVSLKCYNTFRVGGICKYLVSPRTDLELQKLIRYLKKEKISYFILGNGSNLIFSESYYDGVVILLKNFNQIMIKDTRVIAGAGVLMPRLAMLTIQENLTGFEWAIGIPGSVGGCIYNNAEAYKESTFDHLVEITLLTPDNEIKTMPSSAFSSGYRTSFFKENKDYIILKAVFQLECGNQKESLEIVNKRREKRLLSQPLEYPSAGSVFRNPSQENPSGKIIENLGLKGTRIGGAEISTKHANFIINKGNATSNDIRNLIELIHKEVKEKENIDLVMEQEYVGWD